MKIVNHAFIQSVRDKKLLSSEELNLLLKSVDQNAYRVLLYLIHQDMLEPEEAGNLWGESIGFTHLDLDKTLFRPEVVSLLPKQFCMENGLIAAYKFGDKVTAAMADPTDRKTLARAEKLAGVEISPVFSFEDDIKEAVELHYLSRRDVEEMGRGISVFDFGKKAGELSLDELRSLAGEESVVEFVRSMLLLAVGEGASDIHIEPEEALVRVRFRVDGVLSERVKLASAILPSILSRLKIMGGMDISERRRPQDGRLTLPLASRSVDFRASIVPTIYGEKAVLRVMGEVRSRKVPKLEELYFSKKTYDMVKRLTNTPNGVFFITGPTGCGKTTTLFSALREVNNPEVNIVTVEDPVEYRLPGINQIQTSHKLGVNFATVLRSVLRQDPDVILIGEIRDLETARIATEAALTGHLVFSTLHTNDAIQAVTRLIEIGVEPFIVGPSLIGVLAQRLVRTICPQCKEAYTPDKELLDRLFEWDGKREVRFYRGRGCNACGDSGYKGRIAVHEMILVDNVMREMVSKNHPNEELRKYVYSQGFTGMRYDGLKKVLRGLTTIEEVERVTFPE